MTASTLDSHVKEGRKTMRTKILTESNSRSTVAAPITNWIKIEEQIAYVHLEEGPGRNNAYCSNISKHVQLAQPSAPPFVIGHLFSSLFLSRWLLCFATECSKWERKTATKCVRCALTHRPGKLHQHSHKSMWTIATTTTESFVATPHRTLIIRLIALNGIGNSILDTFEN